MIKDKLSYIELRLQKIEKALALKDPEPTIKPLKPVPTKENMENIFISLKGHAKLMAIKQFRECFGCGLREAKDFIDLLEEAMKREDTPHGKQAYIDRLKAGETISFREGGNSMTPKIKSRQKCTYAPITEDPKVGDIVFCKVKGSYYTHLVTGIKDVGDSKSFQISNNHGHVNGWITKDNIFGKVIKIED